MTKITTDFAGGETIAVTKQRLTDILAYWGASTAAYTTWGQARTALNALLTSTTAGTIGSTELAGSFLPKINFLNDPDDMVLDALFGAGEQGVWFDPSDVANLAWRRNLLLWTERLNLPGVWSVLGLTITSDAVAAPDGTLTADRLAQDSSTGEHYTEQSISTVVAGTYCASYHVKADTVNTFAMTVVHIGQGTVTSTANFNVDTGTGVVTAGSIGGSAITSNSVTSLGSGWYRCSVIYTLSSTATSHRTRAYAGPASVIAGNTALGIYLWGAQLELGTVATEYQRITDLNTEVIERFPNATMYQDAAGTTAVTTPGQPIGLRLDKSKGLVLGPEIISNGNFAGGTTGWSGSGSGGWLISGGVATHTVGTYGALITSATNGTTTGKSYVLTFDLAGTGALNVYSRNTLISSVSGAGSKRLVFTASASTGANLTFEDQSFNGTLDNISVKELPGNHAVQSTAGSRLTYGIEPKGGRRNLLTFSEQFDNAAWEAFGTKTVSANQAAAPDGTFTADRLSSVSNNGVYISVPISASTAYRFSAYAKAGTGSNIRFSYATTGGTGANGIVDVAINTGTSVDNGWYRLSYTFTSATGDTAAVVRITSSVNDATPGILIWGAQLELGSTATAYQRVTTDFDVTEAGVNTCHYCQYDGSDDGMVTNSIDFTGTDKMSVFAGVRKNGGAGFQVFAELGTGIVENGFSIFAPSNIGDNYDFRLAANARYTASTYTPPITNILQVSHNLAGVAPTDETAVRINGAAVSITASNIASGNFINGPINIGRRSGGTLPFNGRDYGIIVTGKLANATAIATTEMWLANKTSGVTL